MSEEAMKKTADIDEPFASQLKALEKRYEASLKAVEERFAREREMILRRQTAMAHRGPKH